jgi:hypothetical protein
LSAFLIFVLIAAVATGQQRNEPLRFGEDVIRSLASVRDARTALGAIEFGSEPIADSLNAMTAYRRAIANLRSADLILAPYTRSSAELIAETATATRTIYAMLTEAFEGGLRAQEKLVDMKPGQSPGSSLREASKFTAMAEEGWAKLPIAAAGLSHVLVDRDRTTAEGKLGFLVITDRERADLIGQIDLLFGAKVAAGDGVGQSYPDASAALLARFLRQPWRGSNQE